MHILSIILVLSVLKSFQQIPSSEHSVRKSEYHTDFKKDILALVF